MPGPVSGELCPPWLIILFRLLYLYPTVMGLILELYCFWRTQTLVLNCGSGQDGR